MNVIGSPADAFSPADRSNATLRASRPSLSYWQDAWIRLKKNKQALTSLWMIVALLLFTIVGPMIWTVDPSAQNLETISDSPTLGRTALVLDELPPYEEVAVETFPAIPTEPVDAAAMPAPANLGFMVPPTIQAVRLKWDPVPGAASYVVYRAARRPESSSNLGIPLSELDAGNKVTYEDSFALKSGKTYYAVVAKNMNGEEASRFSVIEADVATSIGLAEAQALKPDAQSGEKIKMPARPLGTDYLGRDVLARLMEGARISLFIGIFAPLLATLLGIIVGGIAGFFGGAIDTWLMRITDFITAIPFLLFMILIRVTLGLQPGESGVVPMLISLAVLTWTSPARLTRGQVLQLRESEFVQASRLLGAKPMYLIFRHLVPNTLGVILVSLTFAIPTAIFTEAFLSFIGMGVVPPTPSWGSMASDSIGNFMQSPHEFLAPAIVISITVLAFNLLGDGLRDALDPRMRSTQ